MPGRQRLFHGAPVGYALEARAALNQPAQTVAHAALVFDDGHVDGARDSGFACWCQAFILAAREVGGPSQFNSFVEPSDFARIAA